VQKTIEIKMETSTSETVKGKKERKPFQWTEARKAAFERCKKARDEKLVTKAKAQSEGKVFQSNKQKQLQNLVKNAALLRKLLDGIDDEEKAEKVEKVVKVAVPETLKEKKEVKEKPRKAPPPPPPKEESSEEEEEEEEEVAPPPPPPPKKNINQFRYTSTSSKNFIPKAPLPTPHRHEVVRQEVKKPGFLFL
jgi:hypothetical protein